MAHIASKLEENKDAKYYDSISCVPGRPEAQ